MSAPKMGGPAFPVPNSANVNGQEGMTLWDYYAAAALTGVESANCAGGEILSPEKSANIAAQLADAMLAERAKRMEAKS